MCDSIDMKDRPGEAKDREIHELRKQVTELEHALKLWKEKAVTSAKTINQDDMKLLALENQVQSAERRLNEFKHAVLTVLMELARE